MPGGVHGHVRRLDDCLDIGAGSLGASQRGDASLDARLANHGMLNEMIRLLRLVGKHTVSLELIFETIWTCIQVSLVLRELMTESKDICINDCITSLLPLSIIVSRAARRVKFSKQALGHEYSIVLGVNRVRDAFPSASANRMLVNGIGKANAQRQQWLI